MNTIVVDATMPLVARTSWGEIQALDLHMVKAKLMSKKNEGLSEEEADASIEAYRRYLLLTTEATFPVVPTRVADLAWHHHILHTRRYMEDCIRLFGQYLHHRPTAEDASTKERRTMRRNSKRTANLYRKLFGERYLSDQTQMCATCDCDDCGAQPLLANVAACKPCDGCGCDDVKNAAEHERSGPCFSCDDDLQNVAAKTGSNSLLANTAECRDDCFVELQ